MTKHNTCDDKRLWYLDIFKCKFVDETACSNVKYTRNAMVRQFHFLRRLGIPGSAATVLSELSKGENSTSEMSKNSGLSRSAILTGISYWQKFGVVSKCNTNMWRLNQTNYVHKMVAILKSEENELISSIAKVDKIIVDE